MKQMKHMKRTELADQRTANRKVFENQDHSRTVEIYLEPVHYQDRGGNWKEMDDTLQETETPQNLQRFREKEIFSGMDMESSVQENKIRDSEQKRGSGDFPEQKSRTGFHSVPEPKRQLSFLGAGGRYLCRSPETGKKRSFL